jgi:hypothetical protein
MFAPDELIAPLGDAGVEYILIGGLAVGAHGFPRATIGLQRPDVRGPVRRRRGTTARCGRIRTR